METKSVSRPPFRDTTLRCRDVMRRRVFVVPSESSVADAARLMAQNGCGMLPVVDTARRLVGVVTDRDIVVRACSRGQSPLEVRVETIMSRTPVCCRPSDSLAQAEELMLEKSKKRLVVTEGDEIAGILTLSDIAQVEQPLQLARLARELGAREIRLEHA